MQKEFKNKQAVACILTNHEPGCVIHPIVNYANFKTKM